MLSKFLLTVLLGAQATLGHAIHQEQEIVTAPLAPESQRWHYETCGSPDDLIELKDVSLSPDPPKPGEDLEVTVTAYVKEKLDEGMYADVLVKVGLIKLIQKRFDVCEEARNANATIQCPIEKGDHDVVQTVSLPKEIPPAAFSILVNAYDVEDRDALCLKLWIDFRPHRGDFGLW